MQLSYSSMSTMKDCERCFYLDRKLGLQRPQGIKSGVPGKVDEILKSSLDKYRGDLPPVLTACPELKGFQLYANAAELKKMRHWKSNPLKMTDGKGNIVIGAFDDLLHNPETDQFAYLDYKTTGKEPDTAFGEKYYQSQCNIYTRFLEAGGRKIADFGVLLFFWPNPGEDGRVNFDSKAIILKPNPAAAEEVFAKAIALLENPEIPTSGPTCEYCLYIEKMKAVK